MPTKWKNRIQRMLKEQDNKCFYCDREFSDKRNKQLKMHHYTREHLVRRCRGGTWV